ncbi:Rieske [2Fe-2S] iron-sulfur domain-containing protein [Aspergillus filifer]
MLNALQTRCTTTTSASDNAQDNTEKPVLEGNLPASWYTEPLFYQFDRRAIFSKHWLLTTHRLRLPEPGSYLRFEIAGFDFLLIKNRKGWSYNLDGKLTKAPKFEDMVGFDAGEYSLFRIHTHVDKTGFVWVNFDAAETPSIPWEKMNGARTNRGV